MQPTVVQLMAKAAQDNTHKRQLANIKEGNCMRTTVCELTPRMKQCREWKKRSVSSFAPGITQCVLGVLTEVQDGPRLSGWPARWKITITASDAVPQ